MEYKGQTQTSETMRTYVRSTSDRSPEEARMMLVLMLLLAFWDKNYMEIKLARFHNTAMAWLLGHMERVVKGAEHLFSLDSRMARYEEVDKILNELAREKVLTCDDEIRFNPDTKKLIREKLANKIGLERDETRVLGPILSQAVLAYQSNERFFNGCDE